MAVCEPGDSSTSAAPLRLFFIADVHSDHDALDRFIEEANRERPHLVLDGGDIVHDGTWAEFRRAYADRERLEAPWHVAKGNHDAHRRGPFPAAPPRMPTLDAFSCGDVRFIVLDNHEQRLDEERFRLLESELAAHYGGRIVVVMHVPPTLGSTPFMTRLRNLVPFRLASPTMRDDGEVRRFTDLMARYRVLAVLAGHSHAYDDQVVEGVRYIVAGTAGGLEPGLRIQREYLDIEIDGRELTVRRIQLRGPAGDPVTFVARAFRFFARVNGFSHAEQGWSFIPSTSVQSTAGVRMTEARGGDNVALTAAASFERILSEGGRTSMFGDLGLSAAPRELAGHLAAGYKLRPIGDFNRGVFAGAGGTVNAGLLRGSGTAGIGAQLELGVEWHGLTVGLRRNWATNHRSASLVLGRRY